MMKRGDAAYLEKAFAGFLEDAPDVEPFGFVIEHIGAATNLSHYESDFVVVTDNDGYYLFETKGQMSEDVPHKNRAAALWCESATILTGVTWAGLVELNGTRTVANREHRRD